MEIHISKFIMINLVENLHYLTNRITKFDKKKDKMYIIFKRFTLILEK